MEQLDVRSAWSQIFFPGMIFPAMFVVGTVSGFSILGTLVISSFRPDEGAIFFLVTAAVAAVLYGILTRLIKAVFHQTAVQIDSPNEASIIYVESPID